MDRTISVVGEAEISAKPDTVVLDLSVSAHERDYEPTAKAAAEQADRLYGAVRKAGFSDSDLKTADFSVNTAYKNVRDENGNYGSVFDGYRCVQRFTLEFPTDMARLVYRFLRCRSGRADILHRQGYGDAEGAAAYRMHRKRTEESGDTLPRAGSDARRGDLGEVRGLSAGFHVGNRLFGRRQCHAAYGKSGLCRKHDTGGREDLGKRLVCFRDNLTALPAETTIFLTAARQKTARRSFFDGFAENATKFLDKFGQILYNNNIPPEEKLSYLSGSLKQKWYADILTLMYTTR